MLPPGSGSGQIACWATWAAARHTGKASESSGESHKRRGTVDLQHSQALNMRIAFQEMPDCFSSRRRRTRTLNILNYLPIAILHC